MRPSDPQRVALSVARRIAELRRDGGLTQETFAARLGVSVQYVRRVEYAETNLTVVQLVRIANALGVKLPALFDEPGSLAVPTGRPPKRK